MRRMSTGFTLIELLVVIGIIGVLAAIILPALRAAREKGYTTQCSSNLRQIGAALQMYTNDFDGLLPHEDDKDADAKCWFEAVDPYLETRGMDSSEINDVKMCPGVQKGKDKRVEGYGMNGYLERKLTPWEFHRLLDSVLSPISDTVAVFDKSTNETAISYKGKPGDFAKRHQGGGNILFLDWHVKWHSRDRIKSDVKRTKPTIFWDPEGEPVPWNPD